MSDFLSFKVVEHIRFFHGALHVSTQIKCKNNEVIKLDEQQPTLVSAAEYVISYDL